MYDHMIDPLYDRGSFKNHDYINLELKLMYEKLKALEEYLLANNMHSTFQCFKSQFLADFPQKPSNQFYSVLEQQSHHARQLTKKERRKNAGDQQGGDKKLGGQPKLPELQVQGLLGKIAYSNRLLQDQKLNTQIYDLMQKPFFMKAHQKLFPDHKMFESEVIENYDINSLDNIVPNSRESQAIKEGSTGNINYLQCEIQPYLKNAVSSEKNEQDFEIKKKEGSNFSLISHPSLLNQVLYVNNTSEDYVDDNDLGYQQLIFDEKQVIAECSKLAAKYGYPDNALRPNTSHKHQSDPKMKKQQKQRQKQQLMDKLRFPSAPHDFYPVDYNGSIYDVLNIPVIFDREKTGLENKRNLKLRENDILVGRYLIKGTLGNGVFAKAFKAIDLLSQQEVCLKMITNNKEYFDQAIDQIKILQYIKANCDPETDYLLKFTKAFYARQHLFLQSQLLKQNLYVAYRKNPNFFSLRNIRIIAEQILVGLTTLHRLNIIHADLKPENILIQSYDPLEVRIADFGNAFYEFNHFTDYVQSRSYRAPEVLLGIQFDHKIDIWSVGCILVELWTKNMLFANLHTTGLLAKIQGIVGPWPQWMLEQGIYVQQYFSKQNFIYYEQQNKYHILTPKQTSLSSRIRTEDKPFLMLIQKMIQIDPNVRISASQALCEQFFTQGF